MRRRACIGRRGGGVTLVEVLATLVLVAIVLPVAMRGIGLSTNLGSVTARRIQATALAESKLAELVASGAWRDASETEGEFTSEEVGAEAGRFRWKAASRSWLDSRVAELEVSVSWESAGTGYGVSLTSLVNVEELR